MLTSGLEDFFGTLEQRDLASLSPHLHNGGDSEHPFIQQIWIASLLSQDSGQENQKGLEIRELKAWWEKQILSESSQNKSILTNCSEHAGGEPQAVRVWNGDT